MLKFSLVFLSIFWLTQSRAYASGPCELEDKAKNLVRFLGRNHYDPAPASVENHNKIIQLVFSEFDPYKLVFTQNDFDYFQKKKYRLNDSLQNQACGFMADFLPVFVKKMETFKKDLTMFSASKALIFNNLDTINLSSLRKLPFARDEFERKNRIQVFIKLWALMRAYSDWDKRSDFQKYVTLNSASILSAELANRECDLFDEMEMKPEALSKRFGQELLKSIAGIYDPHTNYFSEAELEGFNKSLSAEANSFGVILSKSEVNQVQIMEIERGSSAGKSNEIEKGDLVMSIKIDGKPIADFKCMDIWDLQNLIFSSSSKILTLGLKKSNGLTKEVSLTKSIVEVTENHVDGCILINPNLKVGYLPIPSFFDSEINDNDGISGTIAKELLSIQKDGINGLILDLRNNGGGSIQEAIQLIGLFIDVGPIGIFKRRFQKPEIVKETIRGTLYNGPLLVLVNNQSASASEIAAASLQDLGRALVVGNQTFGKASVQTVLPLHPIGKEKNYVKTTIGIFYRTNGLSHQITGVKPDISLTTNLDVLHPTEIDLPNSLVAQPISKKVDFRPSVISFKDSLLKRSKARWTTNSTKYSTQTVRLNPSDFEIFMKKKELFDTTTWNKGLFEIKFASPDIQSAVNDASLLALKKKQEKVILCDPQIGEAFKILNDYQLYSK